ncbi:MAG: hypothetical protein AAFZ63_29590 [Bacteroidota bacterium]
MEQKEVILLLKALAEGIHPVTGQTFPEDSPYQDVYIVRGLFNAIQIIQQKTVSPNSDDPIKNGVQLNKAGQPWSPKEDQELRIAFEKGNTIAQLSQIHQRSKGAIKSRLNRMGYLKS